MENLEKEILTLEGRKRLSLTLVSSVEAFSEECVNLTVKECKLKIIGDKLKIINFNKASGNFSLEGNVRELKFGKGKTSLINKIFK